MVPLLLDKRRQDARKRTHIGPLALNACNEQTDTLEALSAEETGLGHAGPSAGLDLKVVRIAAHFPGRTLEILSRFFQVIIFDFALYVNYPGSVAGKNPRIAIRTLLEIRFI